jgi:rubrerythrin
MKILLDGDEIKLYDFNLLQAYKIAKHLEEQGIEFYETMLHAVRDDGLKEGLQFLLSQERDHLRLFDNKIAELSKTSEDGFEGDDIADYMDSNVFTLFSENEEVKNIVKDREKVIGLGKIIEKRSISFYEKCVENTNDQTVKTAFEGLVEIEKQHLRKLEALAG